VFEKAFAMSKFGRTSTAEQVTAGIDLSGKLALVTGVNSGIGFETLRALTLRGANVIGTARTLAKASEAAGRVAGSVTPLACELESTESIRACAAAVAAIGRPIDIFIANAGIMALPKLEQVNGIEKQFATNHLGHFVLTNRLLTSLAAAREGRVVVLSSGQATRNAPKAGIEFDNLSGAKHYTPQEGYGQSKLANALFARELAKRTKGTHITANAVQPGVIMTNLGRYLPEWKLLLSKVIGFTFMKSLEAGAATQCYVATAPALAGVSGHLFRDCNPVRAGGFTEDDAMAARLWQVSEELTRPYLA
jgi:NAD(P)-dependent dehydrogenase (short-subunit alcohol dehydrogenase family)